MLDVPGHYLVPNTALIASRYPFPYSCSGSSTLPSGHSFQALTVMILGLVGAAKRRSLMIWQASRNAAGVLPTITGFTTCAAGRSHLASGWARGELSQLIVVLGKYGTG